MSRTYRKTPFSYLRHPKTFSELKLINHLKNDPDLMEFGVKLPNRYNRYIPTVFDDLIPSSYYQLDYANKKVY